MWSSQIYSYILTTNAFSFLHYPSLTYSSVLLSVILIWSGLWSEKIVHPRTHFSSFQPSHSSMVSSAFHPSHPFLENNFAFFLFPFRQVSLFWSVSLIFYITSPVYPMRQSNPHISSSSSFLPVISILSVHLQLPSTFSFPSTLCHPLLNYFLSSLLSPFNADDAYIKNNLFFFINI